MSEQTDYEVRTSIEELSSRLVEQHGWSIDDVDEFFGQVIDGLKEEHENEEEDDDESE